MVDSLQDLSLHFASRPKSARPSVTANTREKAPLPGVRQVGSCPCFGRSSGSPPSSAFINSAVYIFVQYTSLTTARFGYLHAGEPPVLGPEVGPILNPFDIDITYGGPVERRMVEVAINGHAVLMQSALFYFTTMKNIGVGRDPNGNNIGLQPFGGAIQTKRLGLGLEP